MLKTGPLLASRLAMLQPPKTRGRIVSLDVQPKDQSKLVCFGASQASMQPNSPARTQLVHNLYQQYNLSLGDTHPLTIALLAAPEIKRIPWAPPGEFVTAIVGEINGILHPPSSGQSVQIGGTKLLTAPNLYWNRPTAATEQLVLLEKTFPRLVETSHSFQEWFAGTDLLREFMRSHDSFNKLRQLNCNIVNIGHRVLAAKKDSTLWSKLMDRRSNSWARLLLLP